jgi:hypothetical protein
MHLSVSRRSALVALGALFSVIRPATAAAQTVDELVTRHVQARGGYEKLKAIQTIRMTRTVATPFTSVEVVIYQKRPNLIRWEQTPKGQTTAIPRAVNATGAWDTAQGKVVPRPEPLAVEGREIDGDIDGLLVDWKEKGHTVTLDGKEKVGTRDAYKLKVMTKGGTARDVYLDAETYLESQIVGKVRLPQMDPKTKEFRYNDTVLVFGDWREVNGVKFPFSVDEERTGGEITQSFAIYTQKIEVNVPMEDSLFVPPASGGF